MRRGKPPSVRSGDLRSRVTAYRPADATDGFGDPGAAFSEVGSFWMQIVPGAGALVDRGPGQTSAEKPEGRARIGVNVRPRDVLKVVAGDEKGTAWLVHAVLHPGGKTTRMTLESYAGVAP